MSRPPQNRRGKASKGGGATLALGSLTHVGMVRSANQDAYCAILAPNAPLGMDALLAVADGMGGHQAGEVASALVIRGLVQHLSSQDAGNTDPEGGDRLPRLLKEVIQRVNAEVNQAASKPETRGMGSTLSMLLLARSSLTIGHVGDSRIYLLRGGQLRQISKDHSWVAEEVARGALTPDAARTHPRRNILTRAMGTAAQVEVDTLVMEVEEGDTLLLCSDGLHGLVSDEEIARMMDGQPPQEACQSLVDRANALGGNDNTTVIVARVDSLESDASSSRQKKDSDQAKTVQVQRGKSTAPRGKGRLALRIVLFPIKALVWVLKNVARALWAGLRFFWRLRK
ncbi:MAG: Stp1/IreP family PP2C-type Ser/Thr phosphatase [Dehalococcoidia bacterium]